MKLNESFDLKLEPIINSNEQLSDWFDRNQEAMAYYELTRSDCNHFTSYNNYDLYALQNMSNACMSWLETELPISTEEKARLAALSIATTYENACKTRRLSPEAETLYAIDIDELIKSEEKAEGLGRSI